MGHVFERMLALNGLPMRTQFAIVLSTVRWLVFIDIDEFLFSETSDDIKPIFTEFEDFAAITIPRFEFGPNGHKQKPPGLVIENYTRAGRRDMESGSSLNSKSAIEPFLATEIGTHKCIVDGVTLMVEPLDSGRLKLRINHYFSKSESEFQNKMRRGYSWKSAARQEQRERFREEIHSQKHHGSRRRPLFDVALRR